jgi:hypothetical protein
MFNEIIFVDFENFTKIIDRMKKADAKIIVLVGFQAKKPFNFAKDLLDSVSSVELLKVKGTGKNALDFFIAYYLGVYTSRNKELKFTICSNDTGYDPLIKHLSENGISIERLKIDNGQEIIENKSTSKYQKQPDLFKTNKDYKKAFDIIKNMPTEKRPGKIMKLEAHLKSVFKNNFDAEEINKIIDEFKRKKYIVIDGEKIIYNFT